VSPKKKVSPEAKALAAMDGRVKVLAERVAILEAEVAVTKRIRQNIAEQTRLRRKLATLEKEAHDIIVQAEPPIASWWERWLGSLGLATMEPLWRTMSNTKTVVGNAP